MKAHIFLIANLKFCLQTPCSFGDMAENVKLIGIPINNFLCIYIIASSPGLHTLFCLWRVNKKLPQGETSQNTFQRSRSISWRCKIHMVKWAHPPLILLMLEVDDYVDHKSQLISHTFLLGVWKWKKDLINFNFKNYHNSMKVKYSVCAVRRECFYGISPLNTKFISPDLRKWTLALGWEW